MPAASTSSGSSANSTRVSSGVTFFFMYTWLCHSKNPKRARSCDPVEDGLLGPLGVLGAGQPGDR